MQQDFIHAAGIVMVKFYKNTDPTNGVGLFIIATKFSLDNLDEARHFIEFCGGEIEKEKSRKNALERFQHLIEDGTYTYFVDSSNGVPYSELPEEEQKKINHRQPESHKWSRWTPEKLVERDGWEEDEVYWFSLKNDFDYTYQVILKEGSIIYKPYFGRDKKIWVSEEIEGLPTPFPFADDWAEISKEEFEKGIYGDLWTNA